MIAALSVQQGAPLQTPPVSQTPSPGFASTTSAVLLTVNTTDCAAAWTERKREAASTETGTARIKRPDAAPLTVSEALAKRFVTTEDEGEGPDVSRQPT